VPARFHPRRLIALLCLAALLFALVTPGAPALALFVPFLLFIELLVVVSRHLRNDDRDPGVFPWISLAPSRAPPLQ